MSQFFAYHWSSSFPKGLLTYWSINLSLTSFVLLGVDEIHLLYSWGQSFRVSLQQIRYVQARCPDHVAVSATVADGKSWTPSVISLLPPGQFKLVKCQQQWRKRQHDPGSEPEHILFVAKETRNDCPQE